MIRDDASRGREKEGTNEGEFPERSNVDAVDS